MSSDDEAPWGIDSDDDGAGYITKLSKAERKRQKFSNVGQDWKRETLDLDYDNFNGEASASGSNQSRPNDIIIITPSDTSNKPMVDSLLFNSKVRVNLLKESEFGSCMSKIIEIKINKFKRHLVVVLDPGLNKYYLDKLYGINKLGDIKVEKRPRTVKTRELLLATPYQVVEVNDIKINIIMIIKLLG